MSERYEYVPHHLLRRPVRDIASGLKGELMAVINENVSGSTREHWVELADIRNASGREFTTSVSNVEPADSQTPDSGHVRRWMAARARPGDVRTPSRRSV
ncbi:hypothetical protein [Streptomyces erythrochromogenes]|uniref:hypothetical protein n=1 Tax=Streptomyces erythrochromogenes TaxID=285574 RepID=UPI0038267F77